MFKHFSIFSILLTFFLSSSALSSPGSNHTWHHYYEIGVLDNCNDAAINSAVICGGTRGIDVESFNSITFTFKYTNSAGTGWECYLQECYEGHATTNCTDATDWSEIAVTNIDPSTGVELKELPNPFRTVSANDSKTVTYMINYRRIRLDACVATGTPDANDKLTVYARAVKVEAL